MFNFTIIRLILRRMSVLVGKVQLAGNLKLLVGGPKAIQVQNIFGERQYIFVHMF